MNLLSLCDYSGAWSQPFADAGWNVIRVDIAHPAGMQKVARNIWHLGADICRLNTETFVMDAVLAAPSCTCFCRPGARWWPKMDESGQTDRDIALFRACLEICKKARLWWALENPPGRHQKLIPELGPPAWQFQPWQYGDPWVKQTYIWGTAKQPPVTNPVEPEPTRRTPNGRSQGRIAFMSSSWKREREKTPPQGSRVLFSRLIHEQPPPLVSR